MKTNIIFVTSRFLAGGIEGVLLQYLSNLNKEKYNITYAIAIGLGEMEVRKDEIPQYVNTTHLINDGFLTKFRKKKLNNKLNIFEKIVDEVICNPIRRFIQKRQLAKLAAQNDVIIDFDCSHYSLIKNIKKRKIAFFHFSLKNYHKGNKKKIARLVHKLDCFDKIITICDAMSEEFIAIAPNLTEKLARLYNPQNFDLIAEKSIEYKPDATDYILCTARLKDNQKDISTLLKAFRYAKCLNCNIPDLYIVGDGTDKQMLIDMSKELNIDNNVHFVGFCKNPMPWIANCKLFILSSKFEGLPGVLIEASILGRAIISTNCPTGPYEILEGGKNGELVGVGDFEAMGQKIVDLLDDSERYNAISNNAKENSIRFRNDIVISKFEEMINSLG